MVGTLLAVLVIVRGMLLTVHRNYTDLTVSRGAPMNVGCICLLLRFTVMLEVCTEVLQWVRLTVLAIGRRCRLSAIHMLVLVVCILLNKELLEFGSIVIASIGMLRLL